MSARTLFLGVTIALTAGVASYFFLVRPGSITGNQRKPVEQPPIYESPSTSVLPDEPRISAKTYVVANASHEAWMETPRDPAAIAVEELERAIATHQRQTILDLMDDLEEMGEKAVPHLVKLTKSSEKWDVRTAATRLLGKIASPTAVSDLLILLESDEHVAVRANAAWALGRIGRREYLGALERAALEDVHELVRQRAREAIEAVLKAAEDH